MKRFVRGGEIDMKHGKPLDPDAPIKGLQGSNLSVVTNVTEFLSGDAIFRRMLSEQTVGQKFPAETDHTGPFAVRAYVEPNQAAGEQFDVA